MNRKGDVLFYSVPLAVILLLPSQSASQPDENVTYQFGEFISYYQNVERVKISIEVNIGSSVAPQHEILSPFITDALYDFMPSCPYSVQIEYHAGGSYSHVLEPTDLLLKILIVANVGDQMSYGSVSCDAFRTRASILAFPHYYNLVILFSDPFLVKNDPQSDQLSSLLENLASRAKECASRLRSSLSINLSDDQRGSCHHEN